MGAAVLAVATVSALSGCASPAASSYPVDYYTIYSNGIPVATGTVTETPPSSIIACGPNAGGPNFTMLVNVPSPPPPAASRNDFRAASSDSDTGGQTIIIPVGGCLTGAIVTVSPPDAAIVGVQYYAADGGLAVITVTAQPGRSYVLRAWSDADGTYLGEYVSP